MTDFLTGVIVSFAGIVAAAGLAHGFTTWREWRKEQKTKQRVAIALTAEVFPMADMVATCASLANFGEFHLPDGDLNTQMLVATLPPEPTTYRALAGQLPLLDIETISAVGAFYGSLDLAKRLSMQHASEKTIPRGHVPILGNAWRGVARCALVAMERVGKYSPVTKEADVAQITELILELAGILDRKAPRVERIDASGKLKIGRASMRAVS
jgi:hypothetical protein